jgi:hypothetical protein
MRDPVIRGHEWRNIWDDGLGAEFDRMERAYFERASQIGPDEADKYHALALCASLVRVARDHVKGVIEEGGAVALEREASDKIEKLTPYQRKMRAI